MRDRRDTCGLRRRAGALAFGLSLGLGLALGVGSCPVIAPSRMALAEETEAPLVLKEEPEVPLEELAAPPLTEAKGAVVLDTAGNELFTMNPDAQMDPASTTKVMTAMVILDSGKSLDDLVPIHEHDVGDGAQMADYGEGDQVPLGELLLVMLVYSGNDAAYNAACYVAGSERAFADLMNEKAAAIGMTHTHFVNSHGYEDPAHTSCARDLAIMGRHAMQNYPLIAQAVLLTEVQANVRGFPTTLYATDRLIGTYPGARGVKTGAVTGSYTFVGAVGRGDHQLYSAVVGCDTWSGRFEDTRLMFDWCYAHMNRRQLGKSALVRNAAPLALDLGLTVALADETDVVGTSWQMLDAPVALTHAPRESTLLEPGKPYGWRMEVQTGEVGAGETMLATRPRPTRLSAFGDLTRPLFIDQGSLGR